MRTVFLVWMSVWISIVPYPINAQELAAPINAQERAGAEGVAQR